MTNRLAETPTPVDATSQPPNIPASEANCAFARVGIADRRRGTSLPRRLCVTLAQLTTTKRNRPIDQVSLVEAERFEPSAAVLLVYVAEPAVFAAGHIAGSVHVAPAELVCGTPPATGRLPSRERLNGLFSRLGYHPGLDILAYDDEGGGWAGRFLWTLDVIGHRRWRYLNGGIHAWVAAGKPIATGAGYTPTPTAADLALDPSPVAEAEDLLSAMNDADQVIWDVRSAEEFRGERRAAKHAGHVPRAKHLDWLRLKNPDDHLRLSPNLPDLLRRHGISPDKAVITHCQTHHRSGLSYMVARLLGFPRIRAYHGSWSEWGNRDDLPIAVGDAETLQNE